MTNFGFIFGSLGQIISLCIFIFLSLIFIFIIDYKDKKLLSRSLLIYFWHTGFSFFYLYLSLTSVSDSLSYFEDAYYGDILINKTPAVIFISSLISILIKFLNFSYLGVFIFYNFIGILALLLIDRSLNNFIVSENKISKLIRNIIVFLPSISFWSASIGKDTIALFALSLLFWLYIKKKNFILIFLTFLLFSFVRPQHASVLFFSSVLTLFFIDNRNFRLINFKYFKFFLFLNIFILSLFSLNYILSLTGLGVQIDNYSKILSFETLSILNEKLKIRQTLPDYHGSGYIQLQNLYLFSEIYTYIFRPMIFESNNIFTFVSSIENTFLLILFIYALYCFCNHKIIKDKDKIFVIFFITALIPLSVLTPNFGISARQKWIILIPFFYFLISTIEIYFATKKIK
tara:strand:- start:926 stop:2131 length:1206 start_codon:yes stop_codon:yes gene_type:complete